MRSRRACSPAKTRRPEIVSRRVNLLRTDAARERMLKASRERFAADLHDTDHPLVGPRLAAALGGRFENQLQFVLLGITGHWQLAVKVSLVGIQAESDL